MNDSRPIASNEDPVCGMTVDVDQARERGLTFDYDDREFPFCGKGCMLDFRDDPQKYLATDYQPSM